MIEPMHGCRPTAQRPAKRKKKKRRLAPTAPCVSPHAHRRPNPSRSHGPALCDEEISLLPLVFFALSSFFSEPRRFRWRALRLFPRARALSARVPPLFGIPPPPPRGAPSILLYNHLLRVPRSKFRAGSFVFSVGGGGGALTTPRSPRARVLLLVARVSALARAFFVGSSSCSRPIPSAPWCSATTHTTPTAMCKRTTPNDIITNKILFHPPKPPPPPPPRAAAAAAAPRPSPRAAP